MHLNHRHLALMLVHFKPIFGLNPILLNMRKMDSECGNTLTMIQEGELRQLLSQYSQRQYTTEHYPHLSREVIPAR